MFNESQKRAISHYLGPAIVLAGPGSGKTTVITHRVKELILEHGVPPEKIMVVTFTKAAAVNMEQRFSYIVSKELGEKKVFPVVFGTFHSIFYRILRLCSNYREDSIIGESQKLDIIKEIAIRLDLRVPSMTDFVVNVVSEISKIKGNMLDINQYISTSCNVDDFRKIYDLYQRELDALGKMDFDDILIKCYRLLINNPRVLRQWQETYSYILIDEFQDINRVQYEIIKLLALPENNIFIVGDDDQSIYGFRGASPQIMRQFKNDYPTAKDIILNINYRCAKIVAWWADNLITCNKNRFKKNILAVRKTKEQSEIKQFRNQQEELDYVTNKIKRYIKKGIQPEEIAILVRNNSSINMLTEMLENSGINSKSLVNKTSIFESYVGKDILAYIRAAESYDKYVLRDNEELIRIINKPSRLISRQIVAEEGMTIEKLQEFYNNKCVKDNIDKMIFDFRIIKNASPYAAITYIRKGIRYEEYLRKYARENGKNIRDLIKQLDNIHREAIKYKSFDDWLEQTSKCKSENSGGVNVITMHGSKGLEFKVVFIVDANQGIIPSSKSVREKDFEEERRVFYVAMTRAIEVLNIYGIREYAGGEVSMSMFVSEILEKSEN